MTMSFIFEWLSHVKEWGSLGLNQGPTGYESAALTAELLPHKRIKEEIIPIAQVHCGKENLKRMLLLHIISPYRYHVSVVDGKLNCICLLPQ